MGKSNSRFFAMPRAMAENACDGYFPIASHPRAKRKSEAVQNHHRLDGFVNIFPAGVSCRLLDLACALAVDLLADFDTSTFRNHWKFSLHRCKGLGVRSLGCPLHNALLHL